ncbi:hypothetical protein [Candidatus Chloroploca sp. Khr17]|uniref:hypothetical protein n=1 Tax=Candidatus Chloroploca sp. Khr17 TaxID=2496869 RepID=UPI0013EC0802|nr:hypothetical protein [Candidatus Chloroploca sp. Khr17]
MRPRNAGNTLACPLRIYDTVANGPGDPPPTAASLVAWAHQISPAWLDEPGERSGSG